MTHDKPMQHHQKSHRPPRYIHSVQHTFYILKQSKTHILQSTFSESTFAIPHDIFPVSAASAQRREVVLPTDALLAARQNAGSVDQSDVLPRCPPARQTSRFKKGFKNHEKCGKSVGFHGENGQFNLETW